MRNRISRVNPVDEFAYAHSHEIISDTPAMGKRTQVRPDVSNWQPKLADGRAQQRWRLLAVQLADDYSKEKGKPPGELAYGWQSAVAGELGVTQPYLWHVLYEDASVNIGLIELAIHKTSVSEAFFFGHFTKEPHYRKFRGPISIRPPMGYPALQRFYDMGCFGMSPTEQEKHLLERMEWEGEPTERTYDLFLQALRSVRGVVTTEVRQKVTPLKRVKDRG